MIKSIVPALLALWAVLTPATVAASDGSSSARVVEDPVSGLIVLRPVSTASAAGSYVASSSTQEAETGVPATPTPLTTPHSAPSVFGSPAARAVGPAASCLHTHAVAYANLAQQPILRIKVTADAAGAVTEFVCNSATTSNVSDMTDVQLYYSGTTPYFSLHETKRTAAKATMNKLAKGAKKMVFSGSQAVVAGDNYFWVTCTVKSRARGPRLDAACEKITLNGKEITPTPAAKDEGVAEIFPYKYRIVPYFRLSNVVNHPNLLTADHFKKMTDIIYCNITVAANGDVQEVGDGLKAGHEKLKQLRGKNDVKIMTCLMHCAGTMPDIVRNETLRNKCAKNLADYVKDNGYDGIDLDWEYPETAELWDYYVLFVSKLREELAGKGVISAAVTPRYKSPSVPFCEMLDYLNTMSYDAGGLHSTMNQLTDDVAYARDTLRLPACKIVGGLPFYTNETRANRNYDNQRGYREVIAWYPAIAPNVNIINDPSGLQHYFNGISLIKSKCMYIVNQKFGGVMIWAYDTDVLMTHPKSLAKAMYTIIKRTKR